KGQQSFEFLPPRYGWIVTRKPRRPAELLNKREQRAVLVIGRAEIPQAEMRLRLEALGQGRGKARLADPGLARNQYDLAFTRFGAPPGPQQQIDLRAAPNQRAERRSAQGLEPTRDSTRAQRLPCRNRPGDPLELDLAEISVFEQIAGQPAGGRG